MDPKPASESAIQLAHWMGPGDANSAGNVHGGTVMKLCDEMEVGVRVDAESPRTGETRDTNTAYLTRWSRSMTTGDRPRCRR